MRAIKNPTEKEFNAIKDCFMKAVGSINVFLNTDRDEDKLKKELCEVIDQMPKVVLLCHDELERLEHPRWFKSSVREHEEMTDFLKESVTYADIKDHHLSLLGSGCILRPIFGETITDFGYLSLKGQMRFTQDYLEEYCITFC